MVEGFRPSEEASGFPLTRMAKAATDGKDGTDLEGYNDYRGVPVIGAWTWNEDIGYGITTEMDVAEAATIIGEIRRQAFLAIGLSGLLLLGLTGSFTSCSHWAILARKV